MEKKSVKFFRRFTLIVFLVLTLIPLYLVLVIAFKSNKEIFSGNYLLPSLTPNFSNMKIVFESAPFFVYLKNTAIVVFGILFLQLIMIIPAAYAFARMTFKGSTILFFLFIIQIMLPLEALIVPNYQIINSMHLKDTLISMMLPFVGSGYGTFLLRQSFKQVPKELEDAAIIDGCGHFKFLWHVLIPLARPTIMTFSLISIATHWNDYLWPLIITDSQSVRTLTIGLGMFVQQESGADWGVLMSATLFICLPIILLFLILQKKFLENFLTSGLKG
ncbi:MAG: sn-glycerol 3-phosphate transport system permease protein [Kosmotogales bacterium]|nr:sn-glycerol 3-phosphate transport system permease protein [Kosmotogales bacterium]